MKIFLAFLIIVAAAKASDDEDGPWVGGLSYRYAVSLNIGTSVMIDLPRNKTQAISDGLIEMTPPERSEGPISLLTMYCLEYYYLCVLYDDTEYTAGIQVGFPKNNITGAQFDFETQGYVSWNVTIDGENIEYWTIHTYFCSKEFLETDAETRIAARKSNKTLQDKGIWVTGTNGSLVFVDKNATRLANNSSFTKQACFPWMGRHFYYNMSSETACTAEGLLSWFPIMESGELIACGYNIVGNIKEINVAGNVFEYPSSTAVKIIVPDAPDCFYELAENPGFTTLHIYFVKEPWLVSCIGQ